MRGSDNEATASARSYCALRPSANKHGQRPSSENVQLASHKAAVRKDELWRVTARFGVASDLHHCLKD